MKLGLKKYLAFVLMGLVASQPIWASPVAPQADIWKAPPTVEEVAAARSVWQLTGDHRYSFLLKSRDEKMALETVNRYLDSLDPNRMIFLSSDVEKFQKKPMWALAAVQGRALVAPLKIYEIYLERVQNRKDWLGSWTPFNQYSTKDTWLLDRSDAKWPATVQEQNQLWSKYMDYNQLIKNSAALNAEKSTVKKPDEKVESVQEEQRQALDRSADLNRAEVMELFLNAFIQTNDPHGAYLTPRRAEEMAISLSLSLDGIGATLSQKTAGIFVEQIVPGSPAAKSGKMTVGDQILGVAQDRGSWTLVSGMRVEEVVDLIRGKSGSDVRLRLARVGKATTPEEITLRRERIILSEQGVQSQMISENETKIGWVKLPVFYSDMRRDGKAAASATKDVEKAIEKLKSEGMTGLILDLRNNGGGALNEAVDLVGLFLMPSDVVQIVDANEKLTQLKSERKEPLWSGPLVVLVNGNSASASEIAAGALQDQGRAIIIGETTYGKGTVQSIIDLDQLWKNAEPTLGQMKMTVAQFFRPSGVSTQLHGVEPNIKLATTLVEEEGEAHYKNAAAASTIAPVKSLAPNNRWSPLLPQLQSSANRRALESQPYQEWLKIRTEVNARKDRKTAPLNTQAWQKEALANQKWKQDTQKRLEELGMDAKGSVVDPVAQIAAGVIVDLEKSQK